MKSKKIIIISVLILTVVVASVIMSNQGEEKEFSEYNVNSSDFSEYDVDVVDSNIILPDGSLEPIVETTDKFLVAGEYGEYIYDKKFTDEVVDNKIYINGFAVLIDDVNVDNKEEVANIIYDIVGNDYDSCIVYRVEDGIAKVNLDSFFDLYIDLENRIILE